MLLLSPFFFPTTSTFQIPCGCPVAERQKAPGACGWSWLQSHWEARESPALPHRNWENHLGAGFTLSCQPVRQCFLAKALSGNHLGAGFTLSCQPVRQCFLAKALSGTLLLPFLTIPSLGVSPVFLPLAFSHLSGLCHAFSSAYSETLCNIGCFNVLQVVHIPVSRPEEPPTCLQSDFPGPGHSLCTRLTWPKAKALPNPS